MTAATEPFTITRTLDYPKALVWDAWSTPDQLARWWGPKGFSLEVIKLEFKPGGIFHYAMVMPTGHKMYGRFIYGDMTPPDTLKFINSFADDKGEITRAPFSPVWPLEVENTLTLDEEGGQTILTLRGNPINANDLEMQTFTASHASMQAGFAGTLDQLAAYLKENS